jgi:superfamily II DNA/RNA helicase
MTNFTQFGLPDALVDALTRMKISAPTSVQRETIPAALTGQDILASAQTGSGKTIAYCIPLIVYLLNHPQACAVILTPTRELATQVNTVLMQLLGSSHPLKTALLIGGAPMGKQISALRKRPRLIVGTPGRITDHLLSGTLSLKDTRFLIVDEADRMLDMGFTVQLDKIAEFLPSQRQTLMFSATLPPNIEKLSKKYLKDPQRISIGLSVQAAPKIKQEVIRTSATEKFTQLLKELNEREGSIIVFVKTRRGADRMSKELQKHGHSTNAIHGDLSQKRRDSVIRAFRSNLIRILIATDVAARGLDIPHIMHVINFDLPQCDEDYIHRIGRTGRAGAEGNSLCLLLPEDNQKWRAISKLMDPNSVPAIEHQPAFEKQRPARGKHRPRAFQKAFRLRSPKQNRFK